MKASRDILMTAARRTGWLPRVREDLLIFKRPDGGQVTVWLDASGRVRFAEWRNDGGTGGQIHGGTPAIVAALNFHRPRSTW